MTKNDSAILCPSCFAPLPPSQFNTDKFLPCPTCEANLQVAVFPAAFRAITPGQSGERILIAGESSCFYHDQKKAVVPCDSCGRFLCALCDVDLDGKHLCPQCLDTGRQKGSLKQLETRRVVYDNAALIIAVTPMVLIIFWGFTLVTAPLAILLGVMSYFKPNSILGFSRLKAHAAIVIALFQIIVWVLMFMGAFESFLT
jgi:hypothetical protein